METKKMADEEDKEEKAEKVEKINKLKEFNNVWKKIASISDSMAQQRLI